MSRKLLVLLALPLAACSSEPEEQEMPVVDGEVVAPMPEDAELEGDGTVLENGEAVEPTGRSLADEAEDSVTAPESEATGKVQPID